MSSNSPSRFRVVNAPYQQSPVVDEPQSPGIYSRDALAAVGLGLSPTFGPQNVSLSQSLAESLSQRQTLRQRTSSARNSPSSAKETTLETSQEEYLDVTVLSASDLPEVLGGTNPYVVVQIPAHGRGQTPAVPGSTDPHFGVTLSISSPLKGAAQRLSRSEFDDDVVNIGDAEDELWTKVQIMVFNKNPSISDELLAAAEIDLGSLLEGSSHGVMSIELLDRYQHPSGHVQLRACRVLKYGR
jgi:hypothetical protein